MEGEIHAAPLRAQRPLRRGSATRESGAEQGPRGVRGTAIRGGPVKHKKQTISRCQDGKHGAGTTRAYRALRKHVARQDRCDNTYGLPGADAELEALYVFSRYPSSACQTSARVSGVPRRPDAPEFRDEVPACCR